MTSRMSNATYFEIFAVASCLFSAISDVSGAEGQSFNFVIPLFGLIALWSRNPRGILLTELLIALTLILDIVYCAVYTPSRSSAAVAFVALDMFTKVGMGVFGHWLLHEMGGSYSVTTQTTEGSGSATGGGYGKVLTVPLDPSTPAGEGYQKQSPALESPSSRASSFSPQGVASAPPAFSYQNA